MHASIPMLRAAFLAVACLGSGCALTPETVFITYPQPQAVPPLDAAPAIRVRVQVTDLRQDQSPVIARKINTWGVPMAPIYSATPAPDLLSAAVSSELRARGYVVVADGDAPLSLELLAFTHRFRTGFFAGNSAATVSFTATVRDGARGELFRRTFTGPFKDSVQIFTAHNVRAAYEGALQAAVRKLVSNRELHQALAAAAAPPAS